MFVVHYLYHRRIEEQNFQWLAITHQYIWIRQSTDDFQHSDQHSCRNFKVSALTKRRPVRVRYRNAVHLT
jgi:hypothetical protein